MQVKWGIIGCGDVTEQKSGPAFQKIDNSEIIAVMRRNALLAEDYAKRHGIPKWYSNAEDLVNDPEVNAIYVATPPYAHLEYVKLAAEVGKPVYVEKPVGKSYDDCLKMNQFCKKANIPLFTAYYRRAQSRFIKIKEIIDSGLIGGIEFVNIVFCSPALEEDYNRNALPWRVIPEFSGGGRFIDLASHTLDILDFLIGPIISAKGIASNQANLYQAEDIVSGIFMFNKNIHGSGTWSFTSGQKIDQVLIVGEIGFIKFGIFSPEEIEIKTIKKSELLLFERPEHVELPMIQTIVDELIGKGKSSSHGDNALRTWWVMKELLKENMHNK
jgi:predicted dehydrogenase